MKYLGLQLDEDLAGESIVNEISKKVNSRLRFLYRYKDYLNKESRKTLCTALINVTLITLALHGFQVLTKV